LSCKDILISHPKRSIVESKGNTRYETIIENDSKPETVLNTLEAQQHPLSEAGNPEAMKNENI
jgi:hypothetical protein